MKNVHGFCDLSVRYENQKSLAELLKTLSDWGYNNVAINQVVEESQFEDLTQKKKKKKGAANQDEQKQLIPVPVDLSGIPKHLTEKLQIFQRVTVYFSTLDQAHKMMQSENLKLYDIVAVVPTSQAALQHACGALDIDVIAMDPVNKSSFLLSRKLYNMAIDRNIFFELTYGTSMGSSAARKVFFATGHWYHAMGKSKNIVVSSDTAQSTFLRAPYDIINLGLICGLSQDQSKKSITTSARSVLLRGESRKRGKMVVFVERLPSPKRVAEDSMDVSESESNSEEDASDDSESGVKEAELTDKPVKSNKPLVKTSPVSPHRKKMRRV